MSQVFGYYKVVSIENNNENKEFPFSLKCVDSSLNEEVTINSRKYYPVNTIIGWEYDCKTGKTLLNLIKQP